MDIRHARKLYIGTTAERTTLSGVLSAVNYGVKFWDTTVGNEYVWDGTVWLLSDARELNEIVLRPSDHSAAQYFDASAAGLVAALVAAAASPGSVYLPAGLYSTDITVPDDTFIIGEYGEAFLTFIYGQVSVGDGSGSTTGLKNLYVYHYGTSSVYIGAVIVLNYVGQNLFLDNCYLYSYNYHAAGASRCISILGSNVDIICNNVTFRPRNVIGISKYAVYRDVIASNPDIRLYCCKFIEGTATNVISNTVITNGYDELLDRIRNTRTLQSFGLQQPVAAKTTTYGATKNDYTILCDASGGVFNINLLSLSDAYDSIYEVGLILNIKKIDSSSNVITIDGSGPQTIDGTITKQLTMQYDCITIQAGPSEWSII